MLHDLLQLRDLEPPMGDLFTHATFAATRALWTTPLVDEVGVPDQRIIHARVARLGGRAQLRRLGVRRGPGYHKCGSRQDLDWVTALRLLAFRDGRWHVALHRPDLRKPAPDETLWFDLGDSEASAVSIEIRKSGIDDGWTPWNLAESAFVLEGKLIDPIPPRRENLLTVARVNLKALPAGITARQTDGHVHFHTPAYDVAFQLNRPGFAFLGQRGGPARTQPINTLAIRPAISWQGPRLHEVGRPPTLAPAVRFDVAGETRVDGANVTYDFTAGPQHYRLRWQVTAAGLVLQATRTAERDVLAWDSAAWTIALRNSVSPSHVLGQLLPEGETGAVALPLLLHLPAHGTWEVASRSPDVFARSDCFRRQDYNSLELKLGEQRTPEGLYLLRGGTFSARITFRPQAAPVVLRPEAPAAARAAVRQTFFTALTYRADTATLSNNGASMHCPICLDTWTAVTLPLPAILPGFRPVELVRTSLERWLTGGPGYAAGRLVQDGVAHEAGDEYLMTDTAGLRGLGDYLRHEADLAWWMKYATAIRQRIAAVRRRDLDGDGLIESPYRTGVSGTSQWSTCWYDVVSFGWKDAFANAILYGALRELAPALRRFDADADAAALDTWADAIRTHYHPTFWNDATGWLAGWRCQQNALHDYGFLAINGAAINMGLMPESDGKVVLQRLLAEARRVGMPDAALGLPGNLHHIPDHDLADIMQGYPLGYYQNGGRTHAQTRHFVMALYRCGLTREADQLLKRLCVGLAEARVFGGNQSGVDWRYWDDRPCGYEGLLTDQFGILEAVYWRWGQKRKKTTSA